MLHAGWNALRRGGADRVQSMLIMNVTVGVAGIATMAFAGLPSWASAPYVVAWQPLRPGLDALLVRMYRSGDLANLSGRAWLLAGVDRARRSLFVGEWMNLIGTIGMGLVGAGILCSPLRRAGCTR